MRCLRAIIELAKLKLDGAAGSTLANVDNRI